MIQFLSLYVVYAGGRQRMRIIIIFRAARCRRSVRRVSRVGPRCPRSPVVLFQQRQTATRQIRRYAAGHNDTKINPPCYIISNQANNFQKLIHQNYIISLKDLKFEKINKTKQKYHQANYKHIFHFFFFVFSINK